MRASATNRRVGEPALRTGFTESERRVCGGPVLLPGGMDSGFKKLRERGGGVWVSPVSCSGRIEDLG